MKSSVVITLFNGESWIRHTLASVLAQTRAPDEIIVVDDGSSDGGPEIVRAEPRVRLLRNPEKGVASARRCGIAVTSTPLVATLDQDDLWHPEHLERLHGALAENPRAGAAAALVRHFAGSIRWGETRHSGPVRLDLWRYFPFHSVVTPSSVLFRRACLEENGGWPLDAGTTDDYLALLRATADAFLVFSGFVTTGYRQHVDAQSIAQRSRDPLAHLAARRALLEGILPLRLRHHPEEEADLHERLRTLDVMAALYQAILREDPELLARSAVELETGTARRPRLFRWMVYKYMGWFMRPRLRSLSGGERAHLQAWLDACWPQDAPGLREEVLAAIHGRSAAPGGARDAVDAV